MVTAHTLQIGVRRFLFLMPLNRYTMNGVTCQATRRRASSRDDKKYMREVSYQGKTRLVHYGDPNLEMQRDNPERRRNFLARHNCSEKKDPFAPGFWACYDWKNTSEKSMNALKMVREDDSTAVYGGYGVIFENRDLEDERFSKSTDFGLNRVNGAPFHIDHTVDAVVEYKGKTYRIKAPKEPVGEIIEVSLDDIGLYMELQVEKASRYWSVVDAMYRTGRAGLSTGSNHTARKSADGLIEYWPINEVSLTLTPAEPETTKYMQRIKSAEEQPEAITAAAQSDIDETHKSQIEVTDMSNEQTPSAIDPQRIDALEETTKAVSEKINQIFELMSQPEPTRKAKQMGYFAPDSAGGEDAEVKSAYDMLYAIKAGNTERLERVYNVKTQTSLEGDIGGYRVPEATLAEIMPTLNLNSGITERVRRIPVNAPSGKLPIPNLYTSITLGTGETVEGLGISSQPRSEGGAYVKETARFAELDYRVYDTFSGYVQVTRELASYAPTVVSILQSAIQADVVAKKEYMVLRGTGAGGEFQGMLGWAGAIGITPITNENFDYADMLAMQAKFIASGGSNGVFLAHPSMIPDIGTFEIGSNGAGVPATIGTAGQLATMPGTNIPILYTQHLPQANASGCVMLVDPQMYGIFVYSELYIEYSRDYDFINGRDTWRFGQLADGKPLMKSAVELAGPGASYTQSPVVYFND